MTHEKALRLVGELLVQHDAQILETAARFLRSGAIDAEPHEDNYQLPKILITAALRGHAEMFAPRDEYNKQEVRNLENF